MFKKLTLLITLAFGLCWSGISDMMAQTPDEYIYFDLAAGDVIFSGGNYTGCVYVEGSSREVTGSHSTDNKYYIYQSSTESGNNSNNNTGYATTADFNDRQNCRVPNYPAVSYDGRAWSDYITDNSDVDAVQVNWNNAISGTDRTGTSSRICFRDNGTYNVVLDNIYTTYEINDVDRRTGGITIGYTEGSQVASAFLSDCKVTLKLKGDNRVGNIYYYSGIDTDTSELHLTSAEGDGNNSGSITVASYIRNFSKNNASCIGSGKAGIGTVSNACSYRTYFDGGTVFAGMPKWLVSGVWSGSNHVTHVIGSRHHTGVIINGGRITAVSNSTAAAIGGGGGYNSAGGQATVDINGGYVYAYNHSIYLDVPSTYNLFVPCVAIGGSSSVESSAALTTINIMGGHVFAQSKGGCAIGGGGSAKEAGGPANINIRGDAYVEAKSLAGSIHGHSFPAGTSIGGGTGGTEENMNGGNAIFHIDGGTLRAGSVGGGSTLSSTGNVGYVEAYITDGDVQAQFMMAAGSTEHCIFDMSGGTLHGSDYTSTDYPLVKSDGGVLWMDDPNGVATISGGEIYGNNASNGGAFYMTGGQLNITGGKICGNTAATNGGSAYMGGGNFEMSHGEVSGNTANTSGGGFYVNGGSITITGGEVMNNTATSGNGGGFYSAGGTVNISNAEISGNHADNGFGGGLYSAAAITVGGETEESGATISDNEAKNGGGFYVAGADDATTTIQSSSIVSNNRATVNGAGAFIESGNLTVKTSDINGNTADSNGGGFYVQGGLSTISGGTVQNNKATNGAGLYMKGIDATHWVNATFTDGTFMQNSATTAGGGIYLDNYSNLYMSGESTIRDNTAGEKGGGVFKTAGNEHSMLQISGTSLQVVDNTVGGQRSNVYLDSYSDYITVDSLVGVSDHIKVGISVNVSCPADLPTPILHCDNVSKLNDIFIMLKNPTGTSGLFDDAGKYLPVYQSDPGPFNENEIFFITTWAAEVTEPENFDLRRISTPAELAWFMVQVNGLRDQDANPDLDGTLINDIDMSAYYWTPIGEWDNGDEQVFHAIYNGRFDGQGHTISGIKTCGIINYYNYGLFGHTGSNADIKNVVLADCDITAGESQRMGSLIAVMDGGTVSNCVVSCKLNPSGTETVIEDGHCDEHYCVVGGLIGETKNNAIIRNCIVTGQIQAEPVDDEFYPGIQAFTVGGLVGMASDSTFIANCFANPEIHHGGKMGNENPYMSSDRYVGGLIGENRGIVENCYLRLERSNELMMDTVSKFGMFAGLNNGTIDSCFYPEESLRNIKVGTTLTSNQPLIYDGDIAPTNYGEYSTTVTPYYYKHNDNLVTMDDESAPSGSLLAKLNEWVEEANTANGDSDYSYWMRTSASPINGDYPVLRYDNDGLAFTTIASRDGINMEYNKSLDDMLDKYDATGNALFVYNTPSEEIETSSDDPLYIDENVALKLAEGVSITNAYVGITLDNSRQKTVGLETANQFNWHMFSTPLANAPLGVDYRIAGTDEEDPTTYNYWDGQTLPQFNFYSETGTDAIDGYFPSKDFDGNNYYTEWDYYCYSEPDYHWINFKRNSASHFHQDVDPHHPNHAPINYTNEATLGVGKGYLLATKEATFLQSHGELNNDNVKVKLTKTNEVQEYYRGCNLIGNPYQAYLDFNQTGLESYVILDEDAGGYVAYTNRASKNAYPTASPAKDGGEVPAPGQYLHMHQGFFVVAASDGQTVTFRPDMCVTNASSTFRGEEQPAYPLVNLAVTESDGSREFVTIELDRPDNGGAAKMKGLRNGTSLIYTSIDGEDYSIAFMPAGTTSAAVRFETIEDGTFTMNWNTQNGTFSYLHLIDNMTGMDIDCLASNEYKFTASPDDYDSRFKLVFSYTGVEENEAASTSSASFAFMMNGNLVVNGEGMADIFDLTGRLVSSTRLTGDQSTIGLPTVARGIYMVRLTNDDGSKVQKVVIE